MNSVKEKREVCFVTYNTYKKIESDAIKKAAETAEMMSIIYNVPIMKKDDVGLVIGFAVTKAVKEIQKQLFGSTD